MALTLQKAAEKMFGAAGSTFDPAIGGPWAAAQAYPSLFYAVDVAHDFTRLPNTTDDVAVVADGTPTLALNDVVGGIYSVKTQPTTPADNEEVYVSSLSENYLFAASKPLYFETRCALTISTSGNIIIGLSDTVGAKFLQDSEAGPAASYDGAVFFKLGGGSVWQFETSNAGTQVTNSNIGAWATATYYTLGFFFDPGAGTTGTITPFFNGAVGTGHSITLAGLQEMHWVVGVKNSAAAVQEGLVDYMRIVGVR